MPSALECLASQHLPPEHMKQITASPALSYRDVASYTATSLLSDLVTLSPALGSGVRFMPDPSVFTTGYLITSAATAPLLRAMTVASRKMQREWEAERDALVEHKNELLEAKKREGRRGGVGDIPFDPVTSTQRDVSASLSGGEMTLRQLEEKIAQSVHVVYVNADADSSTLLEFLHRSRYNAVAFVDPRGARAVRYLRNPAALVRDAFLYAGADTSASVAIRSSSTGGSTHFTVSGYNAFLALSHVPGSALAGLRKTVASNPIAREDMMVLGAPGDSAIFGQPLPEHVALIEKVIARAYRRGGEPEATTIAEMGSPGSTYLLPDGPMQVDIAPTATAAWAKFQKLRVQDLYPSDTYFSTELLKKVTKDHCQVGILKRLALRALITNLVFDEEPFTPEGKLFLTNEHLAWVEELIRAVYRENSAAYKAHMSLVGNAAKARVGKDAAAIARAFESSEILRRAIEDQPDGVLGHHAAVRVPGLSAKLLDDILEAYPDKFVELKEFRRQSTRKFLKRGYTLATGVETDPEEITAELDAEAEEVAERDAEVDATLLDGLFLELQKAAVVHFHEPPPEGEQPSIGLPLSRVRPERVKDITAMVSRHRADVALAPDPKAGGMRLWFRHHPDGDDLVNWKFHHKRHDGQSWDAFWESRGYPEPPEGCTCSFGAQVTDPSCPV